ncbi:MAG: tRNA (N(6)-L-threonylcarbamoyladenosine(37)-C(2))-methylthiotransferase MtaB [Candidatus Omnitrophota bacterium]
MKKTIQFYTFGCKVNQYDTQDMREKLIRSGYKEVSHSKQASICLINTCTVTHKADSEAINLIARLKKDHPKARIIVTGCLAQLDKKKIQAISPSIAVIRNREKTNIQAYLPGEKTEEAVQKAVITSFKGHTRAFLKIQDGCNNACSYCKVPLVRGRSKSKGMESIYAEACALVDHGFKEIVLTGICLGAYGKDLPRQLNLVNVITRLEEIKGLLRIRLSSIEAADVSSELIEKIATSEKLCRHLHIPMQSGDDAVLKKMDRKYNRRYYIDLVKQIQKRIPGIAITTDVLVGFPGENQTAFENTLTLVRAVQPLKVHIFPYSPREHTKAFNFKPRTDMNVIQGRITALKRLERQMSFAFRTKFLNKKIPVLIESASKNSLFSWEGYSDNYIKITTRSKKNLRNKLVFLTITALHADTTIARP